MYTSINSKYNTDANLDASENLLFRELSPHQKCLQALVQNQNEPKQANAKESRLKYW